MYSARFIEEVEELIESKIRGAATAC
jgi:hypothetical protein